MMPPPAGGVLLRKRFELEQVPSKVKCRIAGLGFYELYLNGRRVGKAELDPPFTRYDVRTGYREYDVTEYLQPGSNLCQISLGRGWYAGNYSDVYGSQYASYRHICKAAMRIFAVGGSTICQTSEDWLAAASAVQDDSPRTGETYDANLLEPASWTAARQVMPPGGKLFKVQSAPITTQGVLNPVKSWQEKAQVSCYDFGKNFTGKVKLKVRGSAGSKVILRYGELCDKAGNFSQENINWYVSQGKFQTDCYILCGEPDFECWTPAFSYHGCRYIQSTIEGTAEILELQALPLRSNFAEIGQIDSSDNDFNKLLQAIKQSLVSNFVGYPSDCPHREKNAWLADAHLAADSMLCWFDAADHYSDFVDAIFDYQRPNGQLPGMALGSGYGWHWDFGPVWTVAPIMLAYDCYMQNGRTALIRRHYRNMKKYLDFYWSLRKNHLINVGPGEWKAPPENALLNAETVDSALIYFCLQIMIKFAEFLSKTADIQLFRSRAECLQTHLRPKKPSHITDLAVLLSCGLGSLEDAALLDDQIQQDEYRANCGIVGAKYIPRALAEYGYIDTAYRMFVQHKYPGWQWMLDHGATTLWENWEGSESQNHPMLGDAAAWAVRYLGGIKPLEPGYRRFCCQPQFPQELNSFSWSIKLPGGKLSVSWQRQSDRSIELNLTVPPDCSAEYAPFSVHTEPQILSPGKYRFHLLPTNINN